MSEEKELLIIPHIKIQNANALSSYCTIGFPAMTAWLGGVHALQRKLNQNGFSDVVFASTAVINHNFNLQTYKGKQDYVYSIAATGNPLDKDGKRPSFIEEARCHLEISLIIEVKNIDVSTLIEKTSELLHSGLKLASGDILSFKEPFSMIVNDSESFITLKRQLMPGYAIIERSDLMIEGVNSGLDTLDALLNPLKVYYQSTLKDPEDLTSEVTWTASRAQAGWIVPIAIGFHGISDLALAKNQRDPSTLHRFAESLVTLGEFKMIYRIDELDQLLWKYQYDEENNLYLCQQLKTSSNN